MESSVTQAYSKIKKTCGSYWCGISSHDGVNGIMVYFKPGIYHPVRRIVIPSVTQKEYSTSPHRSFLWNLYNLPTTKIWMSMGGINYSSFRQLSAKIVLFCRRSIFPDFLRFLK